MKVTIDSAEPLADALRVIGALYNVTLAEIDEGPVLGAAATGARTSGRAAPTTNGSSRPAATKKSTPRSEAPKPPRPRRKAAAATTSDIRKWAQASGHAVSSRGALPAAVRAAYAEAHAG